MITYKIISVGRIGPRRLKYDVQFYNGVRLAHTEDFVLGLNNTLLEIQPAVIDERTGEILQPAIVEDVGIRYFVHEQIKRFVDAHATDDLLLANKRTNRTNPHLLVDGRADPWVDEVKQDQGKEFTR